MKIYNITGIGSNLTGSFSGSFTGDGSNITSISSDNIVFNFSAISSSAQIASDISGSVTELSSSLEQRVSTNEDNIDSLTSATSSYLLNTSDTLVGDLTVTGTITAQEFHTEFVSASILYDSGSTKFGNSSDDVHQFTGSASITGSLSINGVSAVIGSGTTNYLPKLTAGSTIGNSQVFDNGTAVGIATTSLVADALLPIQINAGASGQAYFASNNNGGYGLLMGYDNANGYARIRNISNSALTFETNGAERMRITSGGNVAAGAGTQAINGDANLTLRSGVAFSGLDFKSARTSGNIGGLRFFNTGSDTDAVSQLLFETDGRLTFYNGTLGGEPRLTVLSTGYVGIGTTSPAYKLHVATSTGSGATALLSLSRAVGYGETSFTQTYDSTFFSNGKTLTLKNDSGTAFAHFAGNNAGTETNFLLPTGNVGIGTTSPATLVQAVNDVNNSATFSSRWNASGYWSQLEIRNYSSYLNDQNNPQFKIMHNFNDGLNNGYIGFHRGSGLDGGFLSFGSGGTERMRIDPNGKVGIGTTSPLSELHVVGSARTVLSSGAGGDTLFSAINGVSNGYRILVGVNNSIEYTWNNGSNSTVMAILNSGDVGIGTTSPSAKLDINGSVRYRGSIYDEFTFNASGNYSSGTYYTMLTANALAEGVYILTGYIDTYASGGGIYFMKFASIPFYMWAPGSNSTSYTDIPEPIGSGHHKGNALPLFRLQHQLGGDGGSVFLQFNPNANWTGMDGSGGKAFYVNLKRISGV